MNLIVRTKNKSCWLLDQSSQNLGFLTRKRIRSMPRLDEFSGRRAGGSAMRGLAPAKKRKDGNGECDRCLEVSCLNTSFLLSLPALTKSAHDCRDFLEIFSSMRSTLEHATRKRYEISPLALFLFVCSFACLPCQGLSNINPENSWHRIK